MESVSTGLNEAQKRSVSVTMVLVDQALALCERLLRQGGEQGLLYMIEDDLSTLQKDKLLQRIQEMRQILEQLDVSFQLTHHVSTLTQLIGGELTYLWTTLEECASHRLRGYGLVSEALKSNLDPLLVQLIARIRAIERIMGRQMQVIRVR
jgi:hypothetical protein